MRAFPFLKYSPAGNMTLLVRLDRPGDATLTPAERAALATEIIAPTHLGAEQAGFVRLGALLPRLDMMGGELCVNAARALAALLLDEGRLPEAEEDGWRGGQVEVSGAQTPLAVRARRRGDAFEAEVRLDRPAAGCVREPEAGIRLVRLPGIAHLVLDAARHPLPDPWEPAVGALMARHRLLEEEAAGCVWLGRPGGDGKDPARGAWSVTPFVRVRDTGTVCAESACGSGTLAAALALADADRFAATFTQPGGEALSVRLSRDHAWIGGPVRLIARGEVFAACLDKAGGKAGPHRVGMR